MPPEVETLEQANSEMQPGELQDGEAKDAETAELDYKALYENEKAVREKLERDERSRDIQRISQKKRDDMLQAIFERVEKGDLTTAQATTAIKEGESRIESEAASPTQATMESALKDTETRIKSVVLSLGLGKEDGAFVELTDTRANHLNALFEQAIKAYNGGKYEVAEAWRDAATRELSRLTAQVGSERSKPQSGLGLNERNGRGAAVGMSDQVLVNRYSKGESMTVAESLRAIKAMDNGVYPTK